MPFASPCRSRPLPTSWFLMASLWLFCTAAHAEEPGRESEPRLFLPGGHLVRAGQLIDLRWTAADRIRELEILLSLDGGRTYSLCISPRLDPKRCRFVWRVPGGAGGRLRMRIRFNRDGREIEGAPMALVAVSPAEPGAPEPLGLPPLDGDRGRSSRASDRGGVRSDIRPCEISAAQTLVPRPSAAGAKRRVRAAHPAPRAAGSATFAAGPRFVPMRA
jgi:hypothetical protein